MARVVVAVSSQRIWGMPTALGAILMLINRGLASLVTKWNMPTALDDPMLVQ